MAEFFSLCSAEGFVSTLVIPQLLLYFRLLSCRAYFYILVEKIREGYMNHIRYLFVVKRKLSFDYII